MKKQTSENSVEEERLLLIFAENAQAFTASEAKDMRAQLSQLLERKRQSLSATPELLDQYVVELVHRCPNFLDGPVGFEWVSNDYKRLLQRSRIMPGVLKRYWDTIIPKVRKLFVPRGSPQTPEHQVRDVDQTMAVHIAMNKGLSVTHAVEAVIAARAKMGLKTDQKEVYRALKRVGECAAGTWQEMLDSANSEANQKDIADFYCFLGRQSIPETATNTFTQEEEALLGRLSQGLQATDKDDA